MKKASKVLAIISAVFIVVGMLGSKAYAYNPITPTPEERQAYFEIGTNGSYNGTYLSGSMSALEIHAIYCSQLNAWAYGTAYNNANSAVGSYSGTGHEEDLYQVFAFGNGTASQTPYYLKYYSRLEHVGVTNYYRGPYTY